MKQLLLILALCQTLSAQVTRSYETVANLPAAGTTGRVLLRTTDSTLWREGGGPAWYQIDKMSIYNAIAIDTTSTAAGSSFTLTSANYTVLVDATVGTKTINLPAVAANPKRIYIIQKTDASAFTVVIDGNGSETISGATTLTLYSQYSRIAIQAFNGAWWRID